MGAGTALAHGEYSPTIRTVIDRLSPAVPGVEFRVLTAGTARLSAVNRTREELVVMTPTGEPFLRIGRGGVLANVHSLFWYLSGNPDGVGRLPPGVRAGSPPRWERASRRPAWSWFDHRLHPGTTPVPRAAAAARRTARLDSWEVPARLGGRELKVFGHVEYRPVAGALVPRLVSPAAIAAGVQVALLPGQVPGLFLVNSGREPVTVLGREGEPFARIGPRGVEVNLNSSIHVDDQLAKGNARAARRPDLATAPRWRRVAQDARYAWLDARAFYDPQRVSGGVVRRGREAVVARWAVPMRIGTRQRPSIRGTVSWVPLGQPAPPRAGGDDRGVWLAGAGAAGLFVLGLAGAWVLRRRRGTAG